MLNIAVGERTEISLNTRIDDGMTNGAGNVIKLIQVHQTTSPSGIVRAQVVTIQQCPNHIACGTFEEGGEAAKLDFEEQGSIQICGVECQVISPAPRWRRFSCIITPTRTMTVQCVGFCPIMARSRAFLTRRGLASRVSTQVPG